MSIMKAILPILGLSIGCGLYILTCYLMHIPIHNYDSLLGIWFEHSWFMAGGYIAAFMRRRT